MNAFRKAIEGMYKGLCTIKEYQDLKDPVTHITKKQEIPVLENQPCRLSYSKQTSTSESDAPSALAQTIKLFLAPEIEVKAGSKIVVTQNGKTTEFSRSGEPAVYTNHQEIMLELFKEYA
jgi:NAD-dependent oxidoreductase involved in siderophore biosynthesis